MPAPPSKNPNTDRGSLSAGGAGKGGFSGPGVSSLNAPARSAPSAATGGKGGVASPKGPAASQAAAKANATKTSNTKTQTAGRVPGTSAAAAKNTALGKVAQTAKQNVSNVMRGPGGSLAASKANAKPSLTAPGGSYYGPKGGAALNPAARLAAARSVGFSQPPVTRTPGDAAMLGRMMMAESGSIRNQFGLPRTVGLQGVADVVRNRVLSDQFPNTVPSVLTQRKQFSPIADGSFRRTPVNPMATRVAEAILSGEQPPVVGNALNYANIHTVNNLPGYSSAATRRAFNSMEPTARIADARNPISRSHTFGTIGTSDVAFNGPAAYSPGMAPARPAPPAVQQPVQVASAALGSIPRPVPRPADLRAAIPRPVPRPDNLVTGTVARNPYDTQRAVGVPRARPPGVGPERVMGVETYIDPNTGITRNPYEERAAAQYGGYGTFNTPALTAGLSRPAYETDRAGEYSGYGPFSMPDRTGPLSRPAYAGTPRPGYSGYGSPFASLPPAQQEQPRLVSEYAGYGAPMPGTKQIYGRVASADGMVPGWTKDQSRIPQTAPRPTYPAGTYTAPYDVAPRMSPFGNVGQEYHQHTAPPTPSQYRNEMPPAAPHPGTPGSQTADADGVGRSWGDWGSGLLERAGVTPEAVTRVATQAQDGLQEIGRNIKVHGVQGVQDRVNQMTGMGIPQSLKGYGNTMNDNAARYLQQAGANVMMGGPALMGGGSGGGEPQLTPAQMTHLLAAMQANGAAPEEIAYVQSLMTGVT